MLPDSHSGVIKQVACSRAISATLRGHDSPAPADPNRSSPAPSSPAPSCPVPFQACTFLPCTFLLCTFLPAPANRPQANPALFLSHSVSCMVALISPCMVALISRISLRLCGGTGGALKQEAGSVLGGVRCWKILRRSLWWRICCRVGEVRL